MADVVKLKVRPIFDEDTKRTSLFLVVGGPDKETSFWLTADKLKVLIDSPANTVLDLSTKDVDNVPGKVKLLGRDDKNAAFILNGKVLGKVGIDRLTFILSLIETDVREPTVLTAGDKFQAMQAALRS